MHPRRRGVGQLSPPPAKIASHVNGHPNHIREPVGLWCKERPAKLVREARQNRMGAQRGRGGDGVAA